jgi:hypothetical protein
LGWWRATSWPGKVLDPALETFDPFEQGARIIVDFRMSKADDRNLQGDARVEGVAHRHHGGSEHLHRAHTPGGA